MIATGEPGGAQVRISCIRCGAPTVRVHDPLCHSPRIFDRRLYGRRCLSCGLFVPDNASSGERDPGPGW